MTQGCDCSLIIPARNEAAALPATLASLWELMDREQAEIIVVDDASDVPVAALLEDQPSVIHHHCTIRQGAARARNLGAALASGDVLLFLDAHVCFSKGSLAELVDSARSDRGGIRGCATRVVYEWPTFVELARSHADVDPLQEQEYYGWRFEFQPQPNVVVNRQRSLSLPFAVPYVGACALAIRRELFERLGGFDDGLTGFGSWEDAELAMRCWSFGYDVQIVPQTVCYHYTAPRPAAGAASSSGCAPLDLPRYDGSLRNALRVIYLHFPDAVFANALEQLRRDSPDSAVLIGADFPSEEWRVRRKALDALRTRDRDWLLERMTQV